jgi:hypothetical protein
MADMTQTEQLKHVIGTRTMTTDEIRAEFKSRKMPLPDLKLLRKAKHNVLDATGKPMRDKSGALMKENTFSSPERGSWRIAVRSEDPESEDSESAPLVVLSRSQAAAEMVLNGRGAS